MCKCTAVRARMPSKPPPAFLYASLPLCRDRKSSFFCYRQHPLVLLMRLALRSFAASEAGVLSGILTRKASN